jgi:hypothetical protein
VLGLVTTVGAAWLVYEGKNAGFSIVLAFIGFVFLLVSLVPDRFDELRAGTLRAKMRTVRQRAAAVEELAATQSQARVSERELPIASSYLATTLALDALLKPTDGPLAGCVLHVYTYDEASDLLVPFYEPEPAKTPSRWPPGIGVTGQAYLIESFVLATGDHAHNSTHGLTVEEQQKHVDLLEVAAAPVTNTSGDIIAILAASNRVRPGILSSPDGFDELLALAAACARILVDLFGGFVDQ